MPRLRHPTSRWAVAAAVAAAGALAAGAGAAPAAFITVRVGDEVAVVGTKLVCAVARGSVKQPVIACVKADAKGPLPLSYGAGIDSLGLVVAFRYNSKRQPEQLYRRPQARRAPAVAEKRVNVGVGQVVRVAGTTIDCAIVRTGARSVPTVYCSKDNAKGPIPGTFALFVSEEQVAVGKVGRDRRTTVTFVRRQ